jgi:paraquat-inducible protein B
VGNAGDAAFMQKLVENGLRAQLRNGNLLTGQMYVALDFVPQAPKAAVADGDGRPLTLPTAPGGLQDVQQQIAEIVKRLGKVKFDEIGTDLQALLRSARGSSDSLQKTLANANATIDRLTPEAQAALAQVRDTLKSAQSTLDNLDRNVARGDAPLQRNAAQTLTELQRAARALRVLSDYLQQHPESLLRGKPADPDPGRSAESAR